jgi:uncharacterized protein (TIGR03435 family)
MSRICALLVLGFCASVGFTQPSGPQFEVASIKPSKGEPRGVWNEGSHERLRMLDMTLKEIIAESYNVKDYMVSGPAWIDTERFELIAKISPETAKLPTRQRDEQMRLMSQRLLAERFQLVLHRGEKEMQVYALTLAKGGLKTEPGPPSGDWVRMTGGRGRLNGKEVPIAQLLANLGDILHRPVVNETGSSGSFTVTLEWAPEENGAAASDKPSLFTAIQEQMGMKLESVKRPIEVLIVDRAERPTEN